MAGKKKVYLAIFLIQSIFTGMFLVSKAAFNGGMNTFVFFFYRQAAGTVFLLPFAIIFERNKAPQLTLPVLCKIFMLSLFGITLSFNVSGVALIYTSASLAAATSNTLPVITFFIAILLRMETLNLRSIHGMAKAVGVLFCLVGAVTLAFYKGPHMKPLIHHHLLGHRNGEQHQQVHAHSSKTWVKGCFLMLFSNVTWGLYLVLQVRVLERCPSKLLFTTLACFLSAIQSFIVAIVFERDLNQWKLHWDVGLLAVAYCGFVVSGVMFYLQTWSTEKKGPVFVAMWMPLSFIMTTFCSSFLLGEIISLGSVLGGILLVGGLYSVLWGKSKEQQKLDNVISLTVSEDEKDSKESSELKDISTAL